MGPAGVGVWGACFVLSDSETTSTTYEEAHIAIFTEFQPFQRMKNIGHANEYKPVVQFRVEFCVIPGEHIMEEQFPRHVVDIDCEPFPQDDEQLE